jgi:hypothetical protein
MSQPKLQEQNGILIKVSNLDTVLLPNPCHSAKLTTMLPAETECQMVDSELEVATHLGIAKSSQGLEHNFSFLQKYKIGLAEAGCLCSIFKHLRRQRTWSRISD